MRADTLHVTLAFLGPVGIEQLECLMTRCDSLSAPDLPESFSLRLDHLRHWSRHGVIAAASSDRNPRLHRLAKTLVACSNECGIVFPDRAFVAHLTMVRGSKGASGTMEEEDYVDFWKEPRTMPVRSFRLVASLLAPSGARYETLREWNLPSSGNTVQTTADDSL